MSQRIMDQHGTWETLAKIKEGLEGGTAHMFTDQNEEPTAELKSARVSTGVTMSPQWPVRDLSDGLIVRENTHSSIKHMARHFAFGHLPPDLQRVSSQFAATAQFLVDECLYGPELVEALRKLWEAKNCAVIHAGFLYGLKSAFTTNYADRVEELMQNFDPEQ